MQGRGKWRVLSKDVAKPSSFHPLMILLGLGVTVTAFAFPPTSIFTEGTVRAEVLRRLLLTDAWYKGLGGPT